MADEVCVVNLDYIIKLEKFARRFARRLAEYPSKTEMDILVKEAQAFWQEIDKEEESQEEWEE